MFSLNLHYFFQARVFQNICPQGLNLFTKTPLQREPFNSAGEIPGWDQCLDWSPSTSSQLNSQVNCKISQSPLHLEEMCWPELSLWLAVSTATLFPLFRRSPIHHASSWDVPELRLSLMVGDKNNFLKKKNVWISTLYLLMSWLLHPLFSFLFYFIENG